MAAGEFVSILAPGTKQEVESLILLMKQLESSVINVNSKGKNLSFDKVSSSKNNIGELNTELIKQNKIRVESERIIVRQNKATSEEIVNQRILRQNADRLAVINSKLAGEYQKLSARQAQASRAVQDLIARGRTAEQTQRQYDRELRTAQKEFERLNQKVLTADRAVGRFNRNVGNYPQRAITGIRDLVGAFGLVGGVTAIAAITKDIFETTKEVQSLDLALKQVTSTQEEFTTAQQFLLRISDQYGLAINELTRSYTQFYVAAKDKLSGDEIRGIFESIGKAAGAMGLTVEQQQGAFLALSQMLSKGTIQAEELRGQLSERLPGSFGILAKSMGVTEQQLGKMLEQGQVLAANVLPKFAKELEKAYGVENLRRVESLAASTERLGNSWVSFVRTLNEGKGAVSTFFSDFINGAAQALDALSDLIKSRDELLADNSTEAQGRGFANAMAYIKENAEESKQSVEDWANAVKNKVTPSIQDMERRLKIAEGVFEKSDDKLWKFFDPQMWKNHSRSKKEIENLTESIGYAKGELAAADEILKKNNETVRTNIVLTEQQKKEIERLRKERARQNEEEARNQYTLLKMRIESEKQAFEDSMNNSSLYYREREQAANDITSKEIELADAAKNEGLRIAGDNKTKQLIVWEQYYKDFDNIVKDSEERILNLRKSSYDEYQDYVKKFDGEGIAIDKESLGLTKEGFAEYQKELEKTDEKTKKLKQSTEDFLNQFSEGFFADAGLPTLFKVLNDEIEGFGENFAVTFNAVTEVAQEAFNFMNQTSQAYYDNQREMARQDYEIAKAFAGDSAEAQEEIERQYQERQREIKRREWEANKKAALFNIAINTAQAIVAALPDLGLSITVGAIGLAQAAMVQAQEVPAYKEGTPIGGHKGGVMLINDAPGSNFKEVMRTPDGKVFLPQERNMLIDAPMGTEVFKNYDDFARKSGFDLRTMNNDALNYAGLNRQLPTINIDNGFNEKAIANSVTKGMAKYMKGKIGNQNNFNIVINDTKSFKTLSGTIK